MYNDGYYSKRYLYKLTFPNGKVYIGVTNDIKGRWAGGGTHYKGTGIYDAIQECGWDNVEKEVILKLPGSTHDTDILRAVERELIYAYGDKAYNLKCNHDWEMEKAKERRANKQYEIKHFFTIDGITKPAKDWCAEYRRSWGSVMTRINEYGLTPKEALMFPSFTGSGSRRHAAMVEYFERLRREQPV